jgi:DNA polymerase III, alpha subunit
MISSWEERFTPKALDRGYSKTIISEVWSMILSFVGYSFCKPHSASYAMLSFTCAYLKAHFPAEFLAAVISNRSGYYSSYAYMSEARRFGIRILHPDINNSHHIWFGKKDQIQMEFMSIKKLQIKTIELIIDERTA